jgi:hypothetical protein
MRIFVLEPKQMWPPGWELEPAKLRELPSGETTDLPEDIQKMANSEMPLLGRRFRNWLNKEFTLSGDLVWVVWEGRAIKLD